MYNLNPEAVMLMIDKKLCELDAKTEELNKLSIKMANTEREYRVALRKEILQLEVQRKRISIIGDLARGKEEIADLRFKRDLAKNAYYTCSSAKDTLEIHIETLRSKLTWLRAELTNS